MSGGTPFILDPDGRQKLTRLREFAGKRPIDMLKVVELIKTPAGQKAHWKQMHARTVQLPIAYDVTFSIETGHPVGVCRHVSMSVDRPGRLPLPEAVWMVAEVLGFVGDLQACKVWIEDLATPGYQAINAVQPLTLSIEATRQ